VAAVHAGWRGTVLQIVAKTVRRMQDDYGCNPHQIRAGIGPAIGQEAFEVGDEVLAAFLNAGIEMKGFYLRHPQTDKVHIDLKKVNRYQLLEAGIDDHHIEVSDICTYTQAGDFFSARRQGLHSGRMLTGIQINDKPLSPFLYPS
jgi:YfiH family protein